jgi:hypothetical protein
MGVNTAEYLSTIFNKSKTFNKFSKVFLDLLIVKAFPFKMLPFLVWFALFLLFIYQRMWQEPGSCPNITCMDAFIFLIAGRILRQAPNS